MRFGAHLPLMDLGGQRFDVDHLVEYVETAAALGFEAVAANDHLVFGTPWLDGPTALAGVASHARDLRLFTTVANPVVRGPAALAKTLAALDVMSDGRVVAALGPGSSARDYAAAGIPFGERWPRFDEAIAATRALLRGESPVGRYYSVDGPLTPLPAQPGGPPLWVGSWGSEVGLRRAARLGDGWLGSAYNITPDGFRERWRRVLALRKDTGQDPDTFGNGLAKMVAFRDAGVQWLFVWPVGDDLDQLARFGDAVITPMRAASRA